MNSVPRPLLSFAIPAYNVEPYLEHCVHSLLAGATGYLDRIEITIVDDGSTKDKTPQLADALAAANPGIVRAIHQTNGGHGQAVNTGLAHSSGLWFKVIDADDWVDAEALQKLLATLAGFVEQGRELDMVIVNYVYEKVFENKRTPIRYRGILPVGKVFGWREAGRFGYSQNLLMHAVIYRTALLKKIGLTLPQHTCYVDNIFVYVPLPHVKSLYYLDVDLYRYFIGREGQSVNEQVMVSRIDQQLRITRVMIDAFDPQSDISEPQLKAYLCNFLAMMMCICTIFLILSKREDAKQLQSEIWQYLHDKAPASYLRIRKSALGRSINLKGKPGELTMLLGYRLAQRIFKFN
jgi:glycosyltransferase involved in cell wall biosynthesis